MSHQRISSWPILASAPVVARLDLALDSITCPTAWPVARRPGGATVGITVGFKKHPAGSFGKEHWAKENQECWMRCNCRSACGHGAAWPSAWLAGCPGSVLLLMSWWDRAISSGFPHTLVTSRREHGKKCAVSPSRTWKGKGSSRLAIQLLEAGGRG